MHSLDSAQHDNSASMHTTFFLSILSGVESISGLFCSFGLLYNNFSYVHLIAIGSSLGMETVDHNFNLPYGLLSSTSLVQL
jgi:hypothetical protein